MEVAEECGIGKTTVLKMAKLPDSRKPTYEAIQDMAPEPEAVAIEIKTDERVDSVDTDRNPLPTERRHLLSTRTATTRSN
ncbi:hypothetical protein E0H75_26130 [Kribbella capetownensis]|uniref:Uncharacterized protein n=1 Tax=Kribbella capetownensis TaxID=1572659 RepID=A0A4R0JHW2_9ACTN|nr:hypothetical protein [Kribbella capetownensis]TCC46541.1 hypothetical protein E0H75_26130 [Kribbella capetownensis]